jgi:hypothetical protein
MTGLPLWAMGSFALYPGPWETAPLLVYAIGLTTWGVFLWSAVRRSGRAVRLSAAYVTGVAAVIPVGLTLLSYERLGLFWQGRYSLPLLVGVAVMLGFSMDGAESVVSQQLAPATVFATWGMNLTSLLAIVHNYVPYRIDLPGWWVPTPLVLAVLVTLGACAILAGIMSHPRNRPETTSAPQVGHLMGQSVGSGECTWRREERG